MLLMALIPIVLGPLPPYLGMVCLGHSQKVAGLENSMVSSGGTHWLLGETPYGEMQLRTRRSSCQKWRVSPRPGIKSRKHHEAEQG